MDFRGIELGKDCVFHNDQEGLTKLVTWMKELGRVHEKIDIVFGIEPTGHYWFPLAAFLKEQGIQIVEVKRGVGIKRAEQFYAAATVSIGLTEGLTAARIELAALLEQYDLYVRQEESMMTEVSQILDKIPGTRH